MLHAQDGYVTVNFRPSSNAQEEDTTQITVSTYLSSYPDLYIDSRRAAIEFAPLNEHGIGHGVYLKVSGAPSELESMFRRALATMNDTIKAAGDAAETVTMTYEAPAEIARQNAAKEKKG